MGFEFLMLFSYIINKGQQMIIAYYIHVAFVTSFLLKIILKLLIPTNK